MRTLMTYFVKHPIVVNLIMVLVFIFGYFGAQTLRSNFFPEQETKFIIIETFYPGASPEEMEEGIVIKIEDNLKGITGVDRVTSVSDENNARIQVEIFPSADEDVALQDVKNAVDRISSFPVGMEPPVVFKQEVVNFTYSFAIIGDEQTPLKTLKAYARTVEEDLRAFPDISKVELNGFPEEEIEIAVDEYRLRTYEITFEEIAQAIRNHNIELTGGTIKGDKEEMLIRMRQKSYRAAGLEDITVKATPDGNKVKLKEIATLKDVWADNPERAYVNGKPAVVISIQTTTDEDILDAAEFVRNYIADFNEKDGILKAITINDGSVNLRQRIALLTENGIVGAVLVLVFLAMFLNYRLAFWVAIGIPLSFFGLAIVAAFYGLTINVLSLFGMIIVIGLLVDHGVVIAENIYQYYEEGAKPREAAIKGTLDVLPAVLSSVLTTMVAFSMFFFLDGRIGEFFSDIAFVVITVLAISMIKVVIILPAHIAHSKALKGELKPTKVELALAKGLDYLKMKLYAPSLRFFIQNWTMGLAIPVAVLIITIGAFRAGLVKTTFFPFIERDNINVSLELPAGSTAGETKMILDHIEASAWEVSSRYKEKRADGKDIVLNVEQSLGPKAHQGSVNIILLDGETRDLSSFAVNSEIRSAVGEIANAEKLSFGTESPFGKPVSIALMSNELEQLQAAMKMLKGKMLEMDELKDVIDTDEEGLREINISLTPKAELLGLTPQFLMNQVRQGFFGEEVQRLQRGIDEVKVWVRYDMEDRKNIEQLEEMRIRTPDGGSYPLRALANFEVERGVIAINHLNGMREIKVEADVADQKSSVTDILDKIKDGPLAETLATYPEVRPSFEGQSRESAKTAGSVKKVLPIIFILIFSLVVLTFKSLSQSIAIFILVPFAFIGVIWGHFIHDAQISILSGLGIIALIGIIINDALVFVSTYNFYLVKKKMSIKEALYETGLSRFRPIILTSVTTIAGLMPLLLEKSFQAQFLIPMAISIAYGLLIVTFLTLVLLPVILLVFNRVKVYMNWFWTGEKPEEKLMEPAIKQVMRNKKE